MERQKERAGTIVVLPEPRVAFRDMPSWIFVLIYVAGDDVVVDMGVQKVSRDNHERHENIDDDHSAHPPADLALEYIHVGVCLLLLVVLAAGTRRIRVFTISVGQQWLLLGGLRVIELHAGGGRDDVLEFAHLML